MAMIVTRLSEGLKSEIETLIAEVGLWGNKSEFVRDAIEHHINIYWRGDRFEYKN